VVEDLKNGHIYKEIPNLQRNKLNDLVKKTEEFTHAFAQAIRKLARVFEYIESTDDFFGGEVGQWPEVIYDAIGINPLSILRNEGQLVNLFNTVLGEITPLQLYKVISSKPPGSIIVMPDGKQKKSESYDKIVYGEHKIDNILYTCVPAKGKKLTLLASQNESQVIQEDNVVMLRSHSKIFPHINGFPRSDYVRKLYSNEEYYGYLFYIVKWPTMEISLKTDDCLIDEKIYGDDGFICYPYLQYNYSRKSDDNSLCAKINSIRLVSKEHSGKKVMFIATNSEMSLYDEFVNEKGIIGCSERTINIENPETGHIDIQAIDHVSQEVIVINDNTASARLNLPKTMLFSPHSHNQIIPKQHGSSFRFGRKHFVLFNSIEIPSSDIKLSNCKTHKKSILGEYRVYDLLWENPDKPCKVVVGVESSKLEASWIFNKYVEYNLYLNKQNDSSPKFINFSANQGASPADFSITLNPHPDPEEQNNLIWYINISGYKPRTVPFNGISLDFSGKSSTINGKVLENLIKGITTDNTITNLAVDISLCSFDETLASIKFWVLADLKVELPRIVRDGETFSAELLIGQIKKNFTLLNSRGRPKVRVRIEREDETWSLIKQAFEAKVDVEDLETIIDVKANPPFWSVRIGDRNNGRADSVSELNKKEIVENDLLIVGNKSKRPEIFVNNDLHKIESLSWNSGIWIFPFADMKNIINKSNNVNVRYLGLEKNMSISYEAEFLEMTAEPYLLEDKIVGSCRCRGPLNSGILLLATSYDINDNPGSKINHLIKPNGHELENEFFEIDIPDGFVSKETAYIALSVYIHTLDDNEKEIKGQKFGKEWKINVKNEAHVTSFNEFKEIISRLVSEGKPFAARRYLDLLKQKETEYELQWANRKEKMINAMLINESINSIANQVYEALRKEYMFKVESRRGIDNEQ